MRLLSIWGIERANEHKLVTLKRAFNKFVFDKDWYEELKKIEDNHQKQMAILVEAMKKQKNKKDEQGEHLQDERPRREGDEDEFVHIDIFVKEVTFPSNIDDFLSKKDIESFSNETIALLLNKYRLSLCPPTASYLLKLQRIKDSMS